MITLLGALLGLLGSIAPEFFKFYTAKQDNAQELAVMDKQIAMQQAGFEARLEEINTQADIAESASLNDRIKPIGIKWIDGLAASIRPILTYCFFIAYVTVKFAQYKALGHVEPLPWLHDQSLAWFDIISRLWDDEDRGLFAAIIAFWFGGRQMDKVRRR